MMEYQVPNLHSLFIFFIFLFMLLQVWKKSKTNNTSLKLPPGPNKLPLIGNLHQLLGSQPHRQLRDLANKYGGIMHLQLGEIPHIIISSAEAAKEIMKTHDIIFCGRPFLLAMSVIFYNSSDLVFAPYGEYWRQLRKICILELLSLKRVQSFRSIRQEKVSQLVELISSEAGSKINLSKMICSSTYNITSTVLFGKICKEQKEFISTARKIEEIASGFCVSDLFPSVKLLHMISGMRTRMEKLHQAADKLLEDIVNDHRGRKASSKAGSEGQVDDLVDVLLNLQDNGNLEFPLTTENIKAVILDIIVAGSATSSMAVEWTMSELMKNPKVMEKAQTEVRQVFRKKGIVDETELHKLTYLKSIIKETLRLHPSAPLLVPRECVKSCEINGYDIPAKSKVIVNAWAIQRDSKYWDDTESFNPERFIDSPIDYTGTNFEFIPFGAGRRICPGIVFGMANMELQLAQILYHFDWNLPVGLKPEDLDMSESFGSTVKRKEDLYLIPVPSSNY